MSPIRAAVRALDAVLRKRFGVVEFSDDPDCLFRIRLTTAYRDLPLPDGIVARGAPVAEIHWWNEHIPPVGPDGPDLKWAVRMRRKLITTHYAMAQQLLHNPEWREVRAIGATTAMFIASEDNSWERKMARMGYVVFPYDNPGGRFAEFWEGVWAWLLWRTYQAGTLRVMSPFEIARSDFWMSAESMLRIYTKPRKSGPPAGSDRS